MPLYLKFETWTVNGARKVIHVYEVDQFDKHLTFKGTFSAAEFAASGYEKAKDLGEHLYGI